MDPGIFNSSILLKNPRQQGMFSVWDLSFMIYQRNSSSHWHICWKPGLHWCRDMETIAALKIEITGPSKTFSLLAASGFVWAEHSSSLLPMLWCLTFQGLRFQAVFFLHPLFANAYRHCQWFAGLKLVLCFTSSSQTWASDFGQSKRCFEVSLF